jgi:hypothetical protein
MGEIYFVKDGNHRVSVAREWEQEFIDAYVVEIVIPVPLTSDMDEDDLELQKELAAFLEQTQLDQYDPHIAISSWNPGQYAILIEHISFHRWLLGEQRQREISYPEAAISWYTNVYQPLVSTIEKQDILRTFPKTTSTDLYIWLVKYLWHLSIEYRDEIGEIDKDEGIEDRAIARWIEDVPRRSVAKLVKVIRDADWVEDFILQQQRYAFLQRTSLLEERPDSKIEMTVIGQYDILDKHIAVHRWYLGEQRQREVSFSDAAISWYDQVYSPFVDLIREQKILEQFPGRTETDLYLWILEKQSDIKSEYDINVSVKTAAEALADELNPEDGDKPV